MNQISANQAIRKAAKECHVRMWEIAERVGVTEFTLSRRLRHELPDTEAEHLLSLIHKIAADKADREGVC